MFLNVSNMQCPNMSPCVIVRTLQVRIRLLIILYISFPVHAYLVHRKEGNYF